MATNWQPRKKRRRGRPTSEQNSIVKQYNFYPVTVDIVTSGMKRIRENGDEEYKQTYEVTEKLTSLWDVALQID